MLRLVNKHVFLADALWYVTENTVIRLARVDTVNLNVLVILKSASSLVDQDNHAVKLLQSFPRRRRIPLQNAVVWRMVYVNNSVARAAVIWNVLTHHIIIHVNCLALVCIWLLLFITNSCIAEPRSGKEGSKMSRMEGRERNRVNCATGEGGFQHLLSFGWRKFELSIPALVNGSDIQMGLLLLRKGSQSYVGLVFTSLDTPMGVVIVKRKQVWLYANTQLL